MPYDKCLSGVIEGFYGKPWNFEQRKSLFTRMAKWGLNAYMYGPKDDDKHRATWKQAYTKRESDSLRALIRAAEDNGILFIYAISPGVDITYSSRRDMKLLKDKLNQILSFGCRSFAVFFDDIDTTMCLPDQEEFDSFSDAQVYVTNEIYNYLQKPDNFLFCPTEYCTSRADPSVKESKYLNNLGVSLHSGIDIMWTGPKVISHDISMESIHELHSVLRRKPVIWDNIHANDYEQGRLNLGPYDCRSPKLLSLLNGIFTNPNCEFELNYVPLRTFSIWCESSHTGIEYNTDKALDRALKEWTDEFSISRLPDGYLLESDEDPVDSNVNLEMDDEMQSDSRPVSPANSMDTDKDVNDITNEDIKLLIDLFYLPYKHGEEGTKLIAEARWLKENCRMAVTAHSIEQSDDTDASSSIDSHDSDYIAAKEWKKRFSKFRSTCQVIHQFGDRLMACRNRVLLYEIFSYVSDLRWMLYHFVSQIDSLTNTEKCKKATSPEEFSPLRFGGIVGDIHRLIVSTNDYEEHNTKKNSTYLIRPFMQKDEEKLYELCLNLSVEDSSGTDIYKRQPRIIGDRDIGAYIHLHPEDIYVLEDDKDNVCGYICSALNSKQFYEQYESEWLPQLHDRYPKPESDATSWTQEEIIANSLYNFVPPTDVSVLYLSHVEANFETSIPESIIRKMINVTLANLKDKGSYGASSLIDAWKAGLRRTLASIGFIHLQEYNWMSMQKSMIALKIT